MSYALGALGGTRTPTILLTATSRQRVYQFRHERFSRIGTGFASYRIKTGPGPDHRRRCNKSMMEGQGLPAWRFLPAARQSRQHLLDFDRDTVAIDKHHAAGDRQVVGEDLDLVRLGSVQLDDGAAAQPHYLMDGHGCRAEDHHQIDADVIEGWHRKRPERTLAKLPGGRSPRYG